MSNQESLCCYAGIKLTGKDRPDAFECEKCGRIIGTDLPVAERSVEEIVAEIILSVGRTGDVEGEIAKALQFERQKRDELVEAERERIIQEMNMKIPMKSAKKPVAYNEGVTSGWYAAKEFIRQLTQPNNPETEWEARERLGEKPFNNPQ